MFSINSRNPDVNDDFNPVDRYDKVTTSIYSAAAETITKPIPSPPLASPIMPVLDISKPPITLTDVESLKADMANIPTEPQKVVLTNKQLIARARSPVPTFVKKEAKRESTSPERKVALNTKMALSEQTHLSKVSDTATEDKGKVLKTSGSTSPRARARSRSRHRSKSPTDRYRHIKTRLPSRFPVPSFVKKEAKRESTSPERKVALNTKMALSEQTHLSKVSDTATEDKGKVLKTSGSTSPRARARSRSRHRSKSPTDRYRYTKTKSPSRSRQKSRSPKERDHKRDRSRSPIRRREKSRSPQRSNRYERSRTPTRQSRSKYTCIRRRSRSRTPDRECRSNRDPRKRIVSPETGHASDGQTKTLKSFKSKKPRKSELDKLHEDIKESLGDKLLTICNKRSCTVKASANSDTVSNITRNAEYAELIEKGKSLRVVLRQFPLDKLETTNVDALAAKGLISPPNRSVKRQRKCVNEIIPKTKRKQNSISKVKPTKLDESLYSIDYFLRPSSMNKCNVCRVSAKLIVNHYLRIHKNVPVLISRLPPEATEQAMAEFLLSNEHEENSEILDFQNLEMCKKCNFSCRFCQHEFRFETTPVFYEHLTTHTGEYRYRCKICNFKGETRRRVLLHMKTHQVENRADAIDVHIPLINVDAVLGYVCSECNFLQLDKDTIAKHVEQHENTASINIINMSNPIDQPLELEDIADKQSEEQTSATDINDEEPLLVALTPMLKPKRKKKNYSAFLLDSPLEEENLCEMRLEKMQRIQRDLLETKRSCFINKLKTRLESKDVDAPQILHSDIITTEEVNGTVSVNKTNDEGLKSDINVSVKIKPKHSSTPSTVQLTLATPKQNLDSNLVDRLTDKLHSCPTDIVRAESDTSSQTDSNAVILSTDWVDAEILTNGVTYVCRNPFCAYKCAERSLFETHCRLTHDNESTKYYCSVCKIHFPVVELPEIFRHLCKHVDNNLDSESIEIIEIMDEDPVNKSGGKQLEDQDLIEISDEDEGWISSDQQLQSSQEVNAIDSEKVNIILEHNLIVNKLIFQGKSRNVHPPEIVNFARPLKSRSYESSQ